jgi:hypothetical protein
MHRLLVSLKAAYTQQLQLKVTAHVITITDPTASNTKKVASNLARALGRLPTEVARALRLGSALLRGQGTIRPNGHYCQV